MKAKLPFYATLAFGAIVVLTAPQWGLDLAGLAIVAAAPQIQKWWER